MKKSIFEKVKAGAKKDSVLGDLCKDLLRDPEFNAIHDQATAEHFIRTLGDTRHYLKHPARTLVGKRNG